MFIRICKIRTSGLYQIAVSQKNLLCRVVFYQVSISATATMSAPIVRTRYGALKGTVVQNVEGGEYLAFNGIPYAEPPVGQLRFKEPQPPKAWSGIRDARKEGSAAIQVNTMRPTSEIIGSEDCLYLNVSTNSLSGKRAVMVWIHGGAFAMGTGSSDLYGPDYLLKHDIVFVSIYYRLHVLGFLNVDDEEAAGNQ
ncbi:acetylcholinesterase, partial [Cephus cinctus]|uniref:Acetylcholinesterase n=1 Tax=Cephus cinctus TaxID=211228 RepID=A0AAJ7FUS0_CEPCN